MRKVLLTASLLLIPSASFSESILRQRIGDVGNRIESVFTENPAAHEEKTLKDRRRLLVSLIEKGLKDIEAMHLEINQIDKDLQGMIPEYAPTPVPGGVEAKIDSPLIGSMAPVPIQTCVLDAQGMPGECE